ncbi:MAG TPA: TfuA-like protein, partial [Methanoregulaceae archaeon]|nr:TfuA-like protein [Methanoregulaceae archaeon]
LDSLGMIGIGEVYHRFRSGALESDDEVALVYDPESGCALSEPLVNMRATLEAAVQARTVSAEDAESVLRAARSLYFPERTWSGVLRTVPLGEEQRARLAAFVRTSAVDLKRADALAALEYIRAHFT